jgi:hypothetical protein
MTGFRRQWVSFNRLPSAPMNVLRQCSKCKEETLHWGSEQPGEILWFCTNCWTQNDRTELPWNS